MLMAWSLVVNVPTVCTIPAVLVKASASVTLPPSTLRLSGLPSRCPALLRVLVVPAPIIARPPASARVMLGAGAQVTEPYTFSRLPATLRSVRFLPLVSALQSRLRQLAEARSTVSVWAVVVTELASTTTLSMSEGEHSPPTPPLLRLQCAASFQLPPWPTQYRVRVEGATMAMPVLLPLSRPLWFCQAAPPEKLVF